jgi:hypothetical protein
MTPQRRDAVNSWAAPSLHQELPKVGQKKRIVRNKLLGIDQTTEDAIHALAKHYGTSKDEATIIREAIIEKARRETEFKPKST